MLTGDDILEADLPDWRLLVNALYARFATRNFVAGLSLVNRIGEAAEEMNHHPDLDLRYGHLDVRLFSHDVYAVTERDVGLARRISDLAREAGVVAHPERVNTLEVALDSHRPRELAPFWRAVLGLTDHPAYGPSELVDRKGRLPTLWFQESEEKQESAMRFHLDIHVPHDVARDRIASALEAGGTLVSDRHAPSWWVLADPDGNKVCVCTWQARKTSEERTSD